VNSDIASAQFSLEGDQETSLWKEFGSTGSAIAREKLFSAHFNFARQIATRHFLDRRSGDIEFLDLCQLAYAGLLEAIDRFDPDRGTPFRGYAARRISGSVVDGIAKMSEVREQVSFRHRVRYERARSLSEGVESAAPATETLKALIDVAVGLALGFMLEGTNLYVSEGKRDGRADAYESLIWKDTVQRIMAEVSQLPDRERSIVRYHYLSGLSFEQIGAILGLSKGRVSQIHKASMDLLKKRLRLAGDFKIER
jgi:RNA polymerase sigma factor for flagellar operon FliA